MPVHDWTRVSAGTFHAFHLAWLAELQKSLNRGLLPEGYYALAEQVAGEIGPDVLALQIGGRDAAGGGRSNGGSESDDEGGVAVAVAPPHVRLTATLNEAHLATVRRRRLVIRHSSGDRVVAFVEIVSPGNKDRSRMLESFLNKAVSAILGGVHLLVIDLFPPGAFDPEGIHGAIWSSLDGPGYEAPDDAPLTLAAYSASPWCRAYVEPTAVGTPLIDMPLFFTGDHYVNVPLEATYQAAWEGVPDRWRRVIEDPAENRRGAQAP